MLVRMIVAAVLFSGFLALLFFSTKRYQAKLRRRSVANGAGRTRVDIMSKFGWRKSREKKPKGKNKK